MTKIRITRERINDLGEPHLNPFTDRPLINGGCVLLPDPKTGKVTQYFPGDVIDLPDDVALALAKEHKDTVELEEAYQARRARILERKQVRDAARYEVRAAMEQSSKDEEAQRRLRALIEERDRERALDHAKALKLQAEHAEKDGQLARLLALAEDGTKRMAQLEADARERDRLAAEKIAQLEDALLERQTRPAVVAAEPETEKTKPAKAKGPTA